MAVGTFALLGVARGPSQLVSHRGASREAARITQAEKNLVRYEAPVRWNPPGNAFDARKAAGKTVLWLTQLQENPFLTAVGQGFKQALSKAGVHVVTCNGEGNVVGYERCMTEAVALKVNAVENDGALPGTMSAGIRKANSAHIPVLSGAAYDASLPVPPGISAQTSQPFLLAGQLLADWIAVDSHGKAQILFVDSPDVQGSVEEETAFLKEIGHVCPSCAVTKKGVTLADWPTQLPSLTLAALEKNRSIDYVVPAFDPMEGFMAPSITQAGRASTVKAVTVNASMQQMQDLAHHQLVYVEIGEDEPGLGYVEADQVLRVLTGQKPISNYHGPLRVFTRANVRQLSLTTAAFNSGAWYSAPGAILNAYLAHWHLAK